MSAIRLCDNDPADAHGPHGQDQEVQAASQGINDVEIGRNQAFIPIHP
jgi:hypothetical protein